MKQKKNRGISLIVLIIIILVILILATAVIINLSKSNIIGNANEAVFRSDVKSLKIELDTYVSDKIADTLGKYDRKKLNADENTGKYGEEEIEDKNKDGKVDIYDILSSLEKSKLKGKVYVEKGELVFKRSGLTEEEKKILQEEGIEINGMPSIEEIVYESTLNKITLNVVMDDTSEVKKYKYILNEGEEEESSEKEKEYTGLIPGTNYIVEVIAVLKDGTEISKKEIIATKTIEGNIEYIRSEEELTAEDVTVELKYEREIPEGYVIEYKVGEGEWEDYTGVLTITENTTIYGRLYNKELEDEKIGSSVTISNIDKEPPKEPVIVSNYGYPVITEYGIEIDGTIEIKYDTGYGIINVYSMDNGTTWKEYKGKITMPGAGTVVAKSVKENGLETTVTKAINIPTDAIGPAAYDGDDSTGYQTDAANRYIIVDESFIGKKIIIKQKLGDTGYASYIKLLGEDNKTLYSGRLNQGDNELNIVEGTKKIEYKPYNAWGNKDSLLEISIPNEPTINVTNHYPLLTDHDVKQAYCTTQISYHNTSIQKLYKIDDGEWLEYQDKEIRLELGQTLYAKGIDKNGKETRLVSSFRSVVTDAIGKEAYDENDNTGYQTDAANRYIMVDESLVGKKIIIKQKLGSVSFPAYIKLLGDNGQVLYSGRLSQGNNEINIVEGTKKIEYKPYNAYGDKDSLLEIIISN